MVKEVISDAVKVDMTNTWRAEGDRANELNSDATESEVRLGSEKKGFVKIVISLRVCSVISDIYYVPFLPFQMTSSFEPPH